VKIQKRSMYAAVRKVGAVGDIDLQTWAFSAPGAREKAAAHDKLCPSWANESPVIGVYECSIQAVREVPK